MQRGDIRDILRLPLPRQKMTHGCNLAAASLLCGFISGISVSIHRPPKKVGSGHAFKLLLEHFFPWPAGQQAKVGAKLIYDLFRNPLAHALAVPRKSAGQITINRIRFRSRSGKIQHTGLTSRQLGALDDLRRRPTWAHPTLAGSPGSWTLLVEGFYRDVLEMLAKLGNDSAQLTAAENRFAAGKFIWR
jgi:hypothetical protein